MRVRVTHHDSCHHEAEAWNLALAAALSHANKTMLSSSRQSVIRKLMKGEAVNHQGVRFTGRLVD